MGTIDWDKPLRRSDSYSKVTVLWTRKTGDRICIDQDEQLIVCTRQGYPYTPGGRISDDRPVIENMPKAYGGIAVGIYEGDDGYLSGLFRFNQNDRPFPICNEIVLSHAKLVAIFNLPPFKKGDGLS